MKESNATIQSLPQGLLTEIEARYRLLQSLKLLVRPHPNEHFGLVITHAEVQDIQGGQLRSLPLSNKDYGLGALIW